MLCTPTNTCTAVLPNRLSWQLLHFNCDVTYLHSFGRLCSEEHVAAAKKHISLSLIGCLLSIIGCLSLIGGGVLLARGFFAEREERESS